MKKKKMVYIAMGIGAIIIPLIISMVILFRYNKANKPEDKLSEYMNLLNSKEYEAMYDMIDNESKGKISKEDFILKNKNIYEGIQANDIKIEVKNVLKQGNEASIDYETSMNTSAGDLSFSNNISLDRESGKKYNIKWNSKVIFPELGDNEKVKVNETKARRGDILDRNQIPLATDGNSADVGIIPGKLGDNKEKSIQKIATILGISVEYINSKLNMSYVKNDMFIPIKVIADGDERVYKLLEIPGIMVNNKDARIYPLNVQAAHLTGYVQNINAEELEKNKGAEYTKSSVIGKTGLEKIYENKLRGIDGVEIYIQDKDGKKKTSIISKAVKNGSNVKLTIDSNMQSLLYKELENDKGASVAMNPDTGEVLALVSAPGYDPNDFVMGLSDDKWKSLNEDINKPLYNRFQSNVAPGSVFKPITAVIGVDSAKIDPNINKNISGLSWQKDSSWGNYFVTRVSAYGGDSNLLNALVYSDNIYFAKAALDIGKDIFKDKLNSFGFGEKIPFEYGLYNSQFATDGQFKTDVQLADSGYGQGEILLNPVHLASIYTLFQNEGNILTPYIEYKESEKSKVWKANVVSKEAENTVLQDLIQVVKNPSGTGHQAYIDGLTIAGKTGTAEIKLSQTDTEGTELGWFVGMTTNKAPNNLLVVTMAEDVKNRGGSHYVVPKVKKALETIK
ncbi:penicillin-binding transpeptidase domain-containing protein [Clostridium uliginosum]|uniref:Penicillin-binding protein n=1 Tax=Clostridium uliginosum TaxID=119641 RepID=A0A1I1HIC2_9CLOT|nr:penicillin-binding transpeptidase domain-containing protein [Clostridium uliginosum]SFC21708.1 penicillin-binding protein [Clostridium uliginosum]